MKKYLLLFFFGLLAAGVNAQSLPASGFYRVKNVKSNRYVTIVDDYGELDISGKQADLGALRTFPDYNNIVSNAASVIYMKYEYGDSYDLQAQGTGARAIVGYPLQIHANSDGTFWAYASSSGISLYLKEVFDDFSEWSAFGEYGKLITVELNATDKALKFDITPVSSSDDNNYFGLKADVKAGSTWYRSFISGFAFNPASSGMQVFYVMKVDKEKKVAVYDEISGTVPASTPVFVKCNSDAPSANRLDFTFSSPSAISGNLLKGVFFCNTPNEASSQKHEKYTLYDENTMRVLGLTSSGELGFIKAPNSALFIEDGKKYIPSNTAYLVVDAGTPDQLKLVSKSDYSSGTSVTVTARSYTRVYGDPNPTFEYDASESLTGTPSVTCAATATSPVGTYPIVVGQGTVTGATVTGVDGTLTITEAPLTVTAAAASREYGDANPSLTVSYNGFKNGENESVLTTKPTAACTATATSAVGQYDITVSGGAAQNYKFTYVGAKLTVNKAPLTVKADDKSRVEGTANPELTVSYTGFKNGETEAVLDTKPTVTTTATTTSPAGTYPITVSGGSAKNYNLSYQNGTLTVTAGALTVTAKSYTREYGEENPSFGYDVTGTGTLRGTPVISCSATKESPVGTYDIIVSRGSVENENVTYVKGTLTITKAKLTATAVAASREYGAANPSFSVTYSGFKNGETESVLTTKPVASCTANTTSAVGQYDITVSGGAAQNYDFNYVGAKLTVNKAKLTVTSAAASREYGAANPSFSVTYSGFKNGETESVLTTKPVASCTANATSAAGQYDITVSGGAAQNYDFNYVGAKLTVNKARLTATAAAASREYGAVNPSFSVTYSGFKNGETESVLTTKPVASCTANATSAVGQYDITVSGGAAQNYDFNYVGAKLTVTKAPLTVKADDKSRLEGTANPTFTVSYTGFKNGETEAVLDEKPTATTTATISSPAGTYPITVSGGSAKNYALSYQNGTLTITAGTLMVTAKSYTREYGEANPTFEYEVTGTGVLHGTPAISCSATKESPVGTYDIIVSRGTVENDNVTYVKGTLTITAAPLKITANNASREYGDENPTFTVKYEGWKNSDTEASLTKKPAVTTAATKATDAGTAIITASGAESNNYSFSYVNGTLTINKAQLTVKAENATREEHKPNPEFVLTYSGWKNSDTEASLTKKPTASCDADENSTPGTYTIVVSGGEAKNYTFTYVNGVLTVTKEDAIEDIIGDGQTFDVYNTQGLKVRSKTTTLKGLPRGIYVVNGHKILVK